MSFYVVYIVPSGRVSASLFLLTAIYFLPHTTSDSNSDYELFFSRRFLFHLVTHLFSNDELKIPARIELDLFMRRFDEMVLIVDLKLILLTFFGRCEKFSLRKFT